jgi:hypothetical protein
LNIIIPLSPKRKQEDEKNKLEHIFQGDKILYIVIALFLKYVSQLTSLTNPQAKERTVIYSLNKHLYLYLSAYGDPESTSRLGQFQRTRPTRNGFKSGP